PPPRGGVDATSRKKSRSLQIGADGVVEPAERFQHSRPPRPLRLMRLRGILFMSRPPLLVEEGNGPLKNWSSVPSTVPNPRQACVTRDNSFASWTGWVIDRRDLFVQHKASWLRSSRIKPTVIDRRYSHNRPQRRAFSLKSSSK